MEQFSRAAQQAEAREDPRGVRRDRPFGFSALR
jgi:hypothetical protein